MNNVNEANRKLSFEERCEAWKHFFELKLLTLSYREKDEDYYPCLDLDCDICKYLNNCYKNDGFNVETTLNEEELKEFRKLNPEISIVL